MGHAVHNRTDELLVKQHTVSEQATSFIKEAMHAQSLSWPPSNPLGECHPSEQRTKGHSKILYSFDLPYWLSENNLTDLGRLRTIAVLTSTAVLYKTLAANASIP
jgi:hypothetical protein